MLSPFLRSAFIAVLFFAGFISAVQAQDATGPAAPRPQVSKTRDPEDNIKITTDNPLVFMKNVGRDQRDIWTAPFRARVEDLKWIVPIVGLTAGSISADPELSRRVHTTGTIGRHSSTISNGGLAAMAGTPGGHCLMAKWQTNDPPEENRMRSMAT